MCKCIRSFILLSSLIFTAGSANENHTSVEEGGFLGGP